MARTRKKQLHSHSLSQRARRSCAAQKQSYREPSTDEDEEDDGETHLNLEPNPPRALRSNHTRKRSRPVEYSSDSQDTQDECHMSPLKKKRVRKEETKRAPASGRVLRSLNATQKQSRPEYVESSNTDASDSQEDEYSQIAPRKRRAATRAQSTALYPEVIIYSAHESVKIPDWASLPFSVLCQIFQYASFPLCDDRLQRTPSAQWLLNTSSKVCRSFMEPCLQALYRCPPLAPMNHAHLLVEHLKTDQNAMSLNYRNKIESIRFEVSSTALYKYAGQVLDLHGLIRYSTRLKDLEIHHEKDFAPYENLIEPIRWSYPDVLFDALEEKWTEEVEEFDRESNTVITTLREHGPIKLRSWRWSSRLAGPKQQLRDLEALHLTSCFHDLQKIAFVNYQMPKVIRDKQRDTKAQHKERVKHTISMEVQTLAKAIQALPNLQHLIFESCTLVNEELLSLLPSSLRILEIINCSNVMAHGLSKFLVPKGGHLRELLLDHNQSLSLSFLPVLAAACPHLEILRMNLHYYNKQDSNPAYEKILFDDEVPTWPSSLRIIDLNQLRNWDIETAEMFFQSIVDSAAELPNLRELIIKATISMDWKVRAGVRQKWEEAMEKVFLSNRPPPNTFWTSIEAIQSQLEGNTASQVELVDAVDEDEDETIQLPQRNGRLGDSVEPRQVSQPHISTRLQRGVLAKANSKSRSYDDPVPLLERRTRSTRSGITYAEPETSDDSEDELPIPSTPEHDAGWNTYSDLASPPSTVGRTRVGSDDDEPSRRATLSRNRMSRELAGLYASAGQSGRSSQVVLPSSPPASGDDSDDEGVQMNRVRRKPAYVEPFVQGMCDKVDISIGNLRPRQKEYDEGDFLDEEGDSLDLDWNGDDSIPGDDVVFHF